jgi:RHS repeat-associated protein
VLGDLTYGYDANGNRLATGGSFARSGLPTAVLASAYDTANQQLTFGGATQTYDANGNRLTQTDATGTTTSTWDARNRLVALSGPTVTATFTYDALGRRTTKTINGQSTSVLYDGLDTVRESGPEGDASYLRTLGIDEALSRTDATGTLAYLPDVLGSTLALADSGGGLSTTYTYAPFGETAVSGLPSSSPFQFTGRENDGTGLYYYRARYYDPGRGRFANEDPIGLVGGVNPYVYVNGNPLRFTDPTGLLTFVAGAGVVGVVPKGKGIDVSGGVYLDAPSLSDPRTWDSGGFLSGGEAVGLNVSGDVFAGAFWDLQSLKGTSENATVSIGPWSLSVMTDPTTGWPLGATLGFGGGPVPVGASLALTHTATASWADILKWLRSTLINSGECR